jgi:20S proteasome alpha/beta subunit
MPEVRLVIPEDLDRALDAAIKAGFAGNKAELARTALTQWLSTVPTQLSRGYDLETAFSPDGRVFQLEYTAESIKRGGAIVGVCCDHGIALAKELPNLASVSDPFIVVPNPFAQTFRIGQSTGILYCGILADGYFLIEEARRLVETFDDKDKMDVETLATRLTLFMQPYAQRKDVRPFATALIVGGLDRESKPRLFLLNSAGLAQEYRACHAGMGANGAKEILKTGYKQNLKLEEAAALAARAALREQRKPEDVLLAVVDAEAKRFREVPLPEKEQMWKKVFP